jgi:Flp pilus assembly protein TadD
VTALAVLLLNRATGTRLGRAGAVVVCAVLVLGGASVVFLPGPLGERIREALQQKSASRNVGRKLMHWRVAARLAASRPLAGHGLGSFRLLFLPEQARLLATPEGRVLWREWDNTEYAHNEYLQLAAEGGAVGLALALWCLLALRASARQAERTPEWAGAAAGAAAIAVDAVFSFPFHVACTAFLFALCAARMLPPSTPAPPGERPPALRRLGAMACALVIAWVALSFGRQLGSSYYFRRSLRVLQGRPDREQWNHAAALLATAVTLDPSHGRARAQFGRALVNVDLPEGGVRELALSLATFVNPDSYANLGRAHAEAGNRWQAVRWLRRACEIDPNSPEYRMNLGVACLQTGKYSEAAGAFRDAVNMTEGRLLDDPTLTPDERTSMRASLAKGYLGMGTALEQNGEYADAEKALRRAVDVYPEDPRAGLNLGLFYIERGEPEKAVAVYGELVRWRQSPDVDFNLARAHIEAGDPIRAIELLKQIARNAEGSPVADMAKKQIEALEKER